LETKHGTENLKPVEVHILIAIDVASRGIDIEDIMWVLILSEY
jgi:superfamily II DNA/RNA helicase